MLPTSSRPIPFSSLLISFIHVSSITAVASTIAPASLPQVDFSKMGTVALGGSFSGLDWWSSESPFASSATGNPTFSSDGDTLFHRPTDGQFRALATTNSGGVINALCWSKDGSANNGTLYVGGVFESLSGVSASNIASLTLADNSVTALSGGLSGEVNTLYCDDDSSQIWVGGLFEAPIGSGGNVALWSTSSSTWVTPEFGGFNGRVQSIVPSIDNSSIYFGGDFTTRFVQNSSILFNSTSNTNNTLWKCHLYSVCFRKCDNCWRLGLPNALDRLCISLVFCGLFHTSRPKLNTKRVLRYECTTLPG